ncbi:ABC transporter ATP-binding protein [Bacillus massilinigeriensis]|uniref:ABC transporter ATP-binding protein n=1 Tax=Bacillus mediterraneensis TaxID=1805474 RepID=UPI000B11390E
MRLTIDQVSKKYKEKAALHPCNFEAESGSCTVLCGGNGAGKSTLLSIIAGVLAPSTGSVMIEGITVKGNRKKYLDCLGYMPDDFHAQEAITAKEFLSFYASLRKQGSENVEEVLEMIGLKEKASIPVKMLSKGMRQRLLFGQAILAKPPVLLLDEPTNGLDPYWVSKFVEVIEKLKKEGITIVFSTHMMDVAAETGDRILFMKQGRIMSEILNEVKSEKTILTLLKLHRE